MFSVHDLTLVHGDQVLFYNAACQIQPDEKVGVVGRNGAGKSTLLDLLSGTQEADEGSIHVDKRKHIAHVPQETTLSSCKSAFDEAFAAFANYLQLTEQLARIEPEVTRGEADTDTIETYAQLQQDLAWYDDGKMRQDTTYVLSGLGFSETGMQQPVNQLSVGWQMRVLLARQLLTQADFYLFDEPTNHLDLHTKQWFLQFLRNMNAGYLLISHSRYFLDHACDAILEIERGNLTHYTGGFTTYLRKKEEYRAQKEHAKKQQEKEIARKRATIERFKAKPAKAKMAKAMEHQLNTMERIELEPPMPQVSFTFPTITRPGKIVLSVENVGHTFGDRQIFHNVSFELRRGQKAALIAPNGVGKSTLFHIIAGNLALQQGHIIFGHNVSCGYFEQDQGNVLHHKNTIWQEVRDVTHNISERMIRTFLGSFLFSGNTIHRPISALSGGEKNRVAMVKVLLKQANLLLLDEPTNHLDIYAKDVLRQAINQYEGTALYVSHDREFIEQTADTVLKLTPNGILEYHGADALEQAHQDDASQYVQRQAPQKEASKPQPAHTKPSQSKLSGRERQRIHKQIQRREKELEQLEQQRQELTQRLTSLSYQDPAYHQCLSQLSQIEEDIRIKEHSWEELSQQLENGA